MPRAQKRYGTQQIAIAPIPGVRKTAAETGLSQGASLAGAQAQSAETLAQIGEGFARRGAGLYGAILAEERDKADDAAILEAENKLARVEQTLLYGEQGALSRKGKDSFELPELVDADFEKQASEIAKTMRTPKQQAAFNRIRANRGLNISATIHRHVHGERQAWEASELKDGVLNGVNAAVANALDPRRVGEELTAVVARIEKHGPRAGMSPEAVKAAVAGAKTDIHTGVIERLLANGNDRAAKVYFEETKGQIAGTAIERVEKALEVGTLRGEAQREADKILLAGGTFAEQRARAKAIEDPKLRDEVLGRIEHEGQVREREERDRKETAAVDGYNIIDRTGTTTAIPPAMWAAYDGSTRSAMLSYAKQKAAGADPETNSAVYYGYLQMATNQSADFAKTNLLENRHQLSDSDFKQLAGLQLSIRQGNKEAAAKVIDDYRTEADVIDNSLKLAGVDPRDTINGKPNPKTPAIVYLRQRVGELSGALARETGKKPSNADIQAIVDQVLSEPVDSSEGFWSFFHGQATAKRPIVEVKIGNVPSADRKRIEKILRDNGRPVNDDAILGLYIRGQQLAR